MSSGANGSVAIIALRIGSKRRLNHRVTFLV
jgi:hypothetical protein